MTIERRRLSPRNRKILFHSSHGIPGISNRNIWSNGMRPKTYFSLNQPRCKLEANKLFGFGEWHSPVRIAVLKITRITHINLKPTMQPVNNASVLAFAFYVSEVIKDYLKYRQAPHDVCSRRKRQKIRQ